MHGNSPASSGASELAGEIIRFDRFTLIPSSRTLLLDDQPIDIGSRAFDILTLLVMARGRLVTKMEILSAVWPLTIVDESNLRFQIACLRKALGGDFDMIKTISGRGYIFVGNVLSGKQGRLIDANRDPSPDAGSPHASIGYEQARNGANSKNVPVPDGPDVVLIDDDDGVREALSDLLNSFGFSVEAYPEVQSLLNNPNRRYPKCIVLDILMPGQNGLDFQADLKKGNDQTPIIFISGHADVPMSVRAMKAGAIEFLTKPVRHEDLLTAIRSAVQGEVPHR